MALHDIVHRWEQWRELLGPANSRQRREIERRLKTRPALLYWGDSWFMTPLYLNLARQSMTHIDGLAMVVGRPGATAERLFSKHGIAATVDRLRNSPFDMLCLSAGGNDGLGARLTALFDKPERTRRRGRLDAAAAFAIVRESALFPRLHKTWRRLLQALQPIAKRRPAFRVLGHGYAPPLKIGVPGDLRTANIGLLALLKRDVGPWLWRPMQDVLRDKTEGRIFASLLMCEGFRDLVLAPLAREFAPMFRYADLSGVDGVDDPDFWYDEIHPTEAGFARLAIAYNAELRATLPAAKRTAVD